VASNDTVITKSQIISILTESAEKIDEKDAKLYLKELCSSGSGNFSGEVLLLDFLQSMQDFSSNNNFCIAQYCK
jgi:Ca2+-binding EF-hand superfamily protein